MNQKTEERLLQFVEEFESAGPGAVYAVLQVLHNSYITGKHNEFAKHCSAFSCVEGASLSPSSLEATKGPKPPPRTLH